MIPTKKCTSRTLCEKWVTINWAVLLVKTVIICNSFLSLTDYWEHEWLTVVRSVGTDSKIDFVRIFVVFVTDRQAEDWIGWSLCNMAPLICSGSLLG